MEKVEGMMKGLKLSEAEKKGVKIGWRGGKTGAVEVQAIGKLMSEKPAFAAAMVNALGPLWCPMKGLECKDLGENTFLFTFHQVSGKKKAVDNGPWHFENELLVMEEFVVSKTLDEYEFNKIPIWVRIFKLPFGMMSRETGEDIGNQIGECMEVDGLQDGLAVGKYLRVKVRMPINRPLMRGTTVEIDETGRTLWCPFEYEFLPDFCYVCGIIGHLDKECTIKLKKGEEPQYGRWLRWVPPRKQSLFYAKEVPLEIEEGGKGNKEQHVQVSKTNEKEVATNMVVDDAGKGMFVKVVQVEGMKKGDNGKKSSADGGVGKQGENKPEIKKFKRQPRKERAETQGVFVHLGKRRGAVPVCSIA
ncbi:hypothetical protein ACQ4PT_046068 [Festuca glaucescens]